MLAAPCARTWLWARTSSKCRWRPEPAFWKFRYMAPEDAQAIAQDAHRLRMKVAVHAVDKADIQIAVDAGADSVEHAFQATDAEL